MGIDIPPRWIYIFLRFVVSTALPWWRKETNLKRWREKERKKSKSFPVFVFDTNTIHFSASLSLSPLSFSRDNKTNIGKIWLMWRAIDLFGQWFSFATKLLATPWNFATHRRHRCSFLRKWSRTLLYLYLYIDMQMNGAHSVCPHQI